MQLKWNILKATLQCHYKAWLLDKEVSKETPNIILNSKNQIVLPYKNISQHDKLASAALAYSKIQTPNKSIGCIEILYGVNNDQSDYQKISLRILQYKQQAENLLNKTNSIIDSKTPPAFYKNKHCVECIFWSNCYSKLKEKDCISLLGNIQPKSISRYHSKGIFSITQLSHLFRPRRKGRILSAGKYLWELKALAIREKKTYVLHLPDLKPNVVNIYLDFEGLPDEGFQYLLGSVIKQEQEDILFSFWSDNKSDEERNFTQLFEIINQYPKATIYHYSNYEIAALKQASKDYPDTIKEKFAVIETRMVNLLSYFRTHVYPPTYENSLKEIAAFLNFHWSDAKATGLMSITWRKNWEEFKDNSWKQKLQRYNHDDCTALALVHHWLEQLTENAISDNIQHVAQMKKHTPFKLQNNIEYGDDFQYISKAAYFDYQHTKIYWRNENAPVRKKAKKKNAEHLGKGVPAWQPKKANTVIILPPLKKCPHCGHTKIYRIGKRNSYKQTDLKFTSTGIKQYVTEYQAGKGKCAKCLIKHNDAVLRRMHYGDNLFAWVTDMYVSYHISNYMLSKIMQEQFGIFIRPMYLVMRKRKWWKQWDPEINYIRQTVLNSPVIHIDETSVKLVKERGYVWAFASTHSVFYHLALSREIDFLRDILKDYKGIIVTDFFPGFETLTVKKQKCLIHLIRDLNDDLFKNPFDEEYKSIVSNFNMLLKRIIETVDRFGLLKRHLRKHIKDTEKYYRQHIEITYKSELANRYTKRLKKHWEELWTFLYYDGVPWNNNNAEAAIKGFAMYRRGVNGQVSEKGLNDYLGMLSISQTCRYRDISFFDFLRRKKGIWENISFKSLPDYLPFNQARMYVQKLCLKSKKEWNDLNNQNKRPDFIPLHPDKIYLEKGWSNWNDWLNIKF